MMKNILLLTFLVISSQSYSKDFDTSWYGKINMGAINLRIVFNIHIDNSNYIGTMESPDQSVAKIPIEQINVTDSIITISMPKLLVSYEGKMNSKEIIEGTFTLALNGDKDIQVNAITNIIGIKNTIEFIGNKNVTTKIYPQLNQLFQKCDTCTLDE